MGVAKGKETVGLKAQPYGTTYSGRISGEPRRSSHRHPLVKLKASTDETVSSGTERSEGCVPACGKVHFSAHSQEAAPSAVFSVVISAAAILPQPDALKTQT
jgi:hypothetical protein